MSQFFEKYPKIKQYLLPITIGAIGFILLIIGMITSLLPHTKEKSTFQDIATVKSASIPTVKEKQIVLDVEGGVIKQGTYSLPENSRIQDAITAAGGLSPDADREVIAKSINLAAKITDGAKVYIPKKGESLNSGGSSQVLGTSDQSGVVNINEATADQLDALPGIGQVTAEKIINARPYISVNELLSKKIVSSKVFEKIKDKISLY